jgi:DNA polymerase III alpha subunit (gram-positive type)
MKLKEPNIILMDVETTPNMMATWSLWDQHMGHKQIIKERSLICASWKRLGEKKVHAVSIKDCAYRYKKDVYDDFHVIKKLRAALKDADIIIGHNGDKFDLKMFNGRCLVHGVPPMPPISTVDTLKVLKKEFRLNANRLDYVGKLLGYGGKYFTEMKMWTDIIDPAVSYKIKSAQIDKMVEYNKRDVELLEKVYCRLVGWTRNHPTIGLIMGKEDGCGHCGSDDLTPCKVPYRTKTRAYQMYVCNDCTGFNRSLETVGKSRVRAV